MLPTVNVLLANIYDANTIKSSEEAGLWGKGEKGSSQVGIKGSLIGVVVGGVSLSIFGTKNVSPAPGGWSSLTQVQRFAHPEVERAMKTKPEQRLKTAQLSGAASKQNLQLWW